MMPPGMPVATVAIDGAVNAAILAAQMIALTDEGLADRLVKMRDKMTEAVIEKDRQLNSFE